MAEVNVAWAVLGDEGERTRYDQQLLASGATSTPEDPFAHLIRRQRPVQEVHEGPDPDLHQPPAAARYAPILVVLGLLAAIFLFTAYAGGPREPQGTQPVLTDVELPVGTCVTIPPAGGVEEVECGRPGDGTVADTVDWPDPCPVPLVAVPLPDQRQSLCLRD
jgi:hypothetical protein